MFHILESCGWILFQAFDNGILQDIDLLRAKGKNFFENIRDSAGYEVCRFIRVQLYDLLPGQRIDRKRFRHDDMLFGFREIRCEGLKLWL